MKIFYMIYFNYVDWQEEKVTILAKDKEEAKLLLNDAVPKNYRTNIQTGEDTLVIDEVISEACILNKEEK